MVTPVSFTFGFTGVASNIAIGIADVLTALIGVMVIRFSSATSEGVAVTDPGVLSS